VSAITAPTLVSNVIEEVTRSGSIDAFWANAAHPARRRSSAGCHLLRWRRASWTPMGVVAMFVVDVQLLARRDAEWATAPQREQISHEVVELL
jgi:hypothetical protein